MARSTRLNLDKLYKHCIQKTQGLCQKDKLGKFYTEEYISWKEYIIIEQNQERNIRKIKNNTY